MNSQVLPRDFRPYFVSSIDYNASVSASDLSIGKGFLTGLNRDKSSLPATKTHHRLPIARRRGQWPGQKLGGDIAGWLVDFRTVGSSKSHQAD
jgi:hypothetical protein